MYLYLFLRYLMVKVFFLNISKVQIMPEVEEKKTFPSSSSPQDMLALLLDFTHPEERARSFEIIGSDNLQLEVFNFFI